MVADIVGQVSIYLLLGLILSEILQRRGRNPHLGAPVLNGKAYIAVTLFWVPMLIWIILKMIRSKFQ